MQRVRLILLWLMDVIVAVFIGPIDRGERARIVCRMAKRRGIYTMALAGVVVILATVYSLAFRGAS